MTTNLKRFNRKTSIGSRRKMSGIVSRYVLLFYMSLFIWTFWRLPLFQICHVGMSAHGNIFIWKFVMSSGSSQTSELNITCICVYVWKCLRQGQVDRRADSPGTVGGPVSANGQETLNTRGYKPLTHPLFAFSSTYTLIQCLHLANPHIYVVFR